MWTLEQAVDLARQIEEIAPEFGAHVALTGGTLYKDGARKDCDILFYTIRQWDEIDIHSLLDTLDEKLNISVYKHYGWVYKARLGAKEIDLFFPEAFPASVPGEFEVQSAPYNR